MTVEREQIRNREPEGVILVDAQGEGYPDRVLLTVQERDTLLDELEQTDRKLARPQTFKG